MADKNGIAIGLFGPPKGGGALMGPDSDFKVLAHQVLDDKAPMAARVDALHELIHTCIREADEAHADEDEGPESEPAEGDHGGY